MISCAGALYFFLNNLIERNTKILSIRKIHSALIYTITKVQCVRSQIYSLYYKQLELEECNKINNNMLQHNDDFIQ